MICRQSFDFECTWWRLFQKCAMRTKFEIYCFIIYKYILLVRVICEKYWLRGEANYPNRLSGEGNFSCPRNLYFSQIPLTTGAWRFINKIDVGYKKGPVPYIKKHISVMDFFPCWFLYMGRDPFCTLHLTSILLIKRQAPVPSLTGYICLIPPNI